MLIEHRENPEFGPIEHEYIQNMIRGLDQVAQALHGFGMNRRRPGITEEAIERLTDEECYECDRTALLHSAMLTRTMWMMANHAGDPMADYYENLARERERLV